MKKHNIEIGVGVAVFKRNKYWIAYAPSLKTYGYSDKSQKVALEDFDKAIDTFIEVHTKLNTLHEVLLKLGWQRKNNDFAEPKFFNIENIGQYRGLSIDTSHSRKVRIPA